MLLAASPVSNPGNQGFPEGPASPHPLLLIRSPWAPTLAAGIVQTLMAPKTSSLGLTGGFIPRPGLQAGKSSHQYSLLDK